MSIRHYLRLSYKGKLHMKTATLKMERTLYFPLLLLLCSLCSTEELDNEIIQIREQAEPRGRDLTNASDRQQACPRDIHNVLREMSALLAEQRVEIRHLQKDNEGTTVWGSEGKKVPLLCNGRFLQQHISWNWNIVICFQSVIAQAAKLRELDLQKTEVDKLKQQLQGMYSLQNYKSSNCWTSCKNYLWAFKLRFFKLPFFSHWCQSKQQSWVLWKAERMSQRHRWKL